MHIMGALAEFERGLIVERTQAFILPDSCHGAKAEPYQAVHLAP